MTERFARFQRRKQAAAGAAHIPGYVTAHDVADRGFERIGSDWTRGLFDGDFYRAREPARPGVPIVSLVFVQSRSGNTVTTQPSSLGGGDTDLHLVYEGLSRVDADAVMAGSGTARARELVFGVWHPELIALRRARGRPDYPAQVVVTGRGDLDFEHALMFHEPLLQVMVITSAGAADRVRQRVAARPWIDVIDAGEPVSLTSGMSALKARGIDVVSCVGGARTATGLLKAGLVTDIYLTTSPREGGQPNSPFYDGPPLLLHPVVLKSGRGVEEGVRFEHFSLGPMV